MKEKATITVHKTMDFSLSDSKIIRLSIVSNGDQKKYLDIRQFFLSDAKEWQPTQKGIWIPLEDSEASAKRILFEAMKFIGMDEGEIILLFDEQHTLGEDFKIEDKFGSDESGRISFIKAVAKHLNITMFKDPEFAGHSEGMGSEEIEISIFAKDEDIEKMIKYLSPYDRFQGFNHKEEPGDPDDEATLIWTYDS